MRDHTIHLDEMGLGADKRYVAICQEPDCDYVGQWGNLVFATEQGLHHRDNLPALAVSK